jgi:hypothetical protein
VGAFSSGVQIISVSDSCHSGTVLRLLRDTPVAYRSLPSYIAQVAYETHRPLYDAVRGVAKRAVVNILASVVSMAAAEDNQLAADGASNGLFTEKLLQVWDQGRFQGDYPAFLTAVKRLMPQGINQTPNYAFAGTQPTFLSRRPFAVARSATCGAMPVQQVNTVTSTSTQENTMTSTDTAIAVVDNGKWDEVAAALSKQMAAQRGVDDFMATVIARNARMAEEAVFGTGATAGVDSIASRGGSSFQVFWWGIQLHFPSSDLNSMLTLVDPNGDIPKFLRTVVPKDYQKWIDILTPFVAVSSSVLRSLDRGRGVYICISWFAPFPVPLSA